MEEMIARWIRETISEIERAKKNQNLFKMKQMEMLLKGLRRLRDELEISVT
jgi:hypothetical protein